MTYLPIKISLLSKEKAVLPPYLGSALRGALGRALCSDMRAYNYLYNNRSLSGGRKDVSNPYMIVPCDTYKTDYRAGEELLFCVYLLGEAASFAKPVICALQAADIRLGASRFPFELIKAVHAAERRVLWEDGVYFEAAARSVALPYLCLPDVRAATLRTRTPLRIRRDGALLERLDFATLIRNITRRIEELTARYGGWADAVEAARIRALSAEAAVTQNRFALQSLSRYSNRTGSKMDLSGLTGYMTIEGDMSPFVPWLYAARILHIGRNTTFGLGQIEVEFK